MKPEQRPRTRRRTLSPKSDEEAGTRLTVSVRNAHTRYDAVRLRCLRQLLACNGRIDSPCPAPRGGRSHPHRGREMESDVEH